MTTDIVNKLTSIYTGEIKRILNATKLTPQNVSLAFHRATLTPNLPPEQRIIGFINILLSHLPKQEHSGEKRSRLMLLLNDFPNRYNQFLEEEINTLSKQYSNEYFDRINNLFKIKKEDLVRVLFQLGSGKVHLANIVVAIAGNNSTIKDREELNVILKEIHAKFNLAKQNRQC